MSDDTVAFGVYDPERDVERTHRDLPHWFQPDTATFLTFRTYDSLPREAIERQRRTLTDWLLCQGAASPGNDPEEIVGRLNESQRAEFRRLQHRIWNRHLDQCYGQCPLRRPALAQIVGEALLHFDGDRYVIDSFIVMPNHVHVLVQFGPTVKLKGQTDSWLRFTARAINELLGRKGKFWQSEPFDHLVRSAEQFEYLREYIRDNPHNARLQPEEYLYWTRSRFLK